MSNLTEPQRHRHALVLKLREEDRRTFPAIASELNLSVARVTQLYAQACNHRDFARKIANDPEALDVSVRLGNILKNLGITTKTQLRKAITDGILRKARLCGEKSYEEACRLSGHPYEPATKPAEIPSEFLGLSVHTVKALIGAGISTRNAVKKAWDERELTVVKGISSNRLHEISCWLNARHVCPHCGHQF